MTSIVPAVEVIVIGKQAAKLPKFVATTTPALRLAEIVTTANALVELLTDEQLDGIRILLACYGVRIEL